MAPWWHDLWHAPLGWRPSPTMATLAGWVDQALMPVFFFSVGLEIKREAIAGELASPARRRGPVLAAVAGMALPALIYLALVWLPGGAAGPADGAAALARGWAIPAATDIAFAIGIVALAGGRVPVALRTFLLAVAVVDDLGAVAIIAVAYSHDLALAWLAAGAALWLAMAVAARRGLRRIEVFVAGTVGLWLCLTLAGLHGTVAGVAGALTVPLARDARGHSPARHAEHVLAPWVNLAIMPIFALANAGVRLAPAGAGPVGWGAPAWRAGAAVAVALVLGKQAGIFGAVWLAERTGIARRPRGATWRQVWGIALVAGVGFTMGLFMTTLAFPAAPAVADVARLGIFAGSLVAGAAGLIVLRLGRGRGG